MKSFELKTGFPTLLLAIFLTGLLPSLAPFLCLAGVKPRRLFLWKAFPESSHPYFLPLHSLVPSSVLGSFNC